MRSYSASVMEHLGFVYLPGGLVRLGTENPLPCRLEGHRYNEMPCRTESVGPFWISRFVVNNFEYEVFNEFYTRSATSPDDEHPATDLTYLEALRYAKALSSLWGPKFDLPTEKQWVFAAAPYGLEYPWGNEPNLELGHVGAGGATGPLHVIDNRYGENWCGLLHMGGNVQEMLRGTYQTPGNDGFASDGMYYIAKGGDWQHCRFSPGVARRLLVDVASRAPTVGFRLVVDC